jgi:hypothetical protein
LEEFKEIFWGNEILEQQNSLAKKAGNHFVNKTEVYFRPQ